jgi:hypothetical protein
VIPGEAMPGTLSTAGRLVFFADEAGYLRAADARDGRLLWSFYTGQTISPMTYAVEGKQFVAIAAATDIIAFGLFEPSEPLRNPQERRIGPTSGGSAMAPGSFAPAKPLSVLPDVSHP